MLAQQNIIYTLQKAAFKTKKEKYMSYNKQKSIKRFTYGVSLNETSKKAGSNQVTITTNPVDGQYATGTVGLSMSVKEAQVLQSFLNNELSKFNA